VGEWRVIGVPSSAGAHHAGQERAPDALRAAGLLERLQAAGEKAEDSGNLPGAAFAVDRDNPGARNLAAVVLVAGEVAAAVERAAASGQLLLVIGGDCTITLGAIAGFRRSFPDAALIYVDGDTDLSVPGSGSGVFDSMGVAHLLGRGAPELAGLNGQVPLLEPDHLAIVGPDPRETDDAGRDFLAGAGVSLTEAPAFAADPEAAASRALRAIGAETRRFLVHFDADVADSGDLPLGNFPHYGSGVSFDQVIACLRRLRAHPSFAGIILTEVNPTHDADGSLLDRYISGLATALTS
jgi:arginase